MLYRSSNCTKSSNRMVGLCNNLRYVTAIGGSFPIMQAIFFTVGFDWELSHLLTD